MKINDNQSDIAIKIQKYYTQDDLLKGWLNNRFDWIRKHLNKAKTIERLIKSYDSQQR